MQDENRRNEGDTTDNQYSSSIWKRMRDTEVPVEQKNKFKVDSPVGGVPQDAILKDEEQMKQINETVETLKDGSKSVRDDLKKGGDIIFTQESSRVIYEMGNVELFELGQISLTVLCHSCLKHVPEGLKFCGCSLSLTR